ncbi:NEDD8 ultimate buster 1 isoform X2 [Anabrus simplex]|uniref:NEDD8 ultimate buster 1 isoform X2 n=1 Tax=Anabrus simplex TaxID=316456 RepID=UPI0034DD715B
MSHDLRIEGILLQIREKLNCDQVKLWLPPYFIEGIGCCEAEIERLSEDYSTVLGIERTRCLTALRELQVHSLERLRERNHYQETGIATLKVRISGDKKRTNQLSLPIRLSANGQDLLEAVAAEIKEQVERVKLICNGLVLKANVELAAQGLKHGSNIMAIILHNDPHELQAFDVMHKEMEKTKEDAKLLAGRSSDYDESYLLIEDQSGHSLNLPPEERQHLLVAMSLHEKGRTAMKKEDYALALILLLEADKEFSACNSKLLSSVDNYAVLNLDIAWCYLCLRSVTQLPEAEERLKKCEESFHRSYGPNLERLLALKGTTGNEEALFMRLHLLQAIVLFHQNKRKAAAELLDRAERELHKLKVDDSSLGTLMELGYTASEARLSLRATHGDVNAAVELINRRNKERQEARKREEAERKLNRQRRRLGKCADGVQWVEPSLHKLLMSMGYESHIACCALQQTNNNVQLSVQLIEETPHLLRLTSSSTVVEKEALEKVIAVGFDPRMAKVALKKHHGNVEKAIEELVACGGVIDGEDWSDNESDDSENEERNNEEKKKLREKEEEAYRRLAEGISTREDDHLDLTLVHEEAFLREYKALLNNTSPHH